MKQKPLIKKVLWNLMALMVLFVAVVIVNFLIFQKKATVVSKGEPIEVYNEPQSALLVVDIQEATTGTISTDQHYI